MPDVAKIAMFLTVVGALIALASAYATITNEQ